MGWYDFEIPQLFIVENSKQIMNYVNTLVWRVYKTLLLTIKNTRNYSGFYQSLSGYYMVFMNYIA